MNRKHGENVNRNNGKANPKYKPKTEDGKNRIDESESQVKTIVSIKISITSRCYIVVMKVFISN